MAASYGFSIDVSGNSIAELKKIEQELSNLGLKTQEVKGEVENGFQEMGESAKEFGNLLVEVFAAREIYEFGKELLHLTAEFQGFENVIKYSSMGVMDASRNFDYVSDAITRMHLPMKETMESFSEMQAGFYGTGIEGDKLRKVFEGVAEASSVLHLQPEQFSRVTFALKEIGELGTLQARQLRMLAFALPGAANLAAQAMGMTSEELHEKMKKGEISSADFLPKFAATLTGHFQKGLPNAGESLIAQMNDEKNEMLKTFLDFGKQLMPLFNDILKTIASAFRDIKAVFNWLNQNNALVDFLKRLFDVLAQLLPIWGAYKIVLMASTFAADAFAGASAMVTEAFGAEGAAATEAAAGITAFETALNSTIIGAAIVSLGEIVEKFIALNKQLDEVIDKKFKLSENTNFFKSQEANAAKIVEQFNSIKDLSPEAKKSLATEVAEFQRTQKDSMALIAPRVNRLAEDASHEHPRSKADRFFHGVGFPALFTNDGAQRIIDSANAQKAALASNKMVADSIAKIGVVLTNKFGITPTGYKSDSVNGAKSDAFNTSQLAGASGGLGEAKVINIHIDTIQKIGSVQGENLDKAAQKAVEYIIRTVNNLSYSQGAM